MVKCPVLFSCLGLANAVIAKQIFTDFQGAPTIVVSVRFLLQHENLDWPHSLRATVTGPFVFGSAAIAEPAHQCCMFLDEKPLIAKEKLVAVFVCTSAGAADSGFDSLRAVGLGTWKSVIYRSALQTRPIGHAFSAEVQVRETLELAGILGLVAHQLQS